jgi:uncharacterized protein YgiM (DUF1202 family)
MKTILIFLLLILLVSCNSNDKKQETKRTAIGRGLITTIADGYDVKEVNLWSATTSDRKRTGSMRNGEEVIILKEDVPYYLIESANGDGRKGYCMKEFVILRK